MKNIGSTDRFPALPVLRLMVIFLLLQGLAGCNYYKVSTRSPVTTADLRWETFNNKYLVLRSGGWAWHLTEPVIAGNTLSGIVEKVEDDRNKYLVNGPEGTRRYERFDSSLVLNMVQLYMKDSLLSAFHPGDKVGLDLSTFSKMEIYQKDKARSTTSKVVPAIVVPVFAVGLVAVIVALTKSSCPLIYTKNNNGYEFAGEIFGGAVDVTLERHDYLPLPGFRPDRKGYRLVISNGLPEVQYINLAELWIVHHPENVAVLPDRYGTIRTISRTVLPLQAISTGRADLRPLLNTRDKQCFAFDEPPTATGDTNAFNQVTLSFPLAGQTDTAKLVIRAGNSFWGDYTYGEFTKLFGYTYNDWVRRQGKSQAERNARWKLDQKFALMAYLETPEGWKFIDYFDLIGPLGTRDLVMPVGLSGALVSTDTAHNRVIRIRLESGYKFWDLDYAALDFSADPVYRVDHIAPSTASTESGVDVSRSLSRDDTAYYVQLKTGEQGFVLYKCPPPGPPLATSVILHTKGYYEHVRNYANPPDYPAIQSFLVPGRFSRFSWQNYTEFVQHNGEFISDPQLP